MSDRLPPENNRRSPEPQPPRIADPRSSGNGFARSEGLLRWGCLLGDLAYRLDRPHRTVVRNNLAFAFPSWTEGQVAAVARGVFRNLGMSIMEMIQATRDTSTDILARYRLTGEDHMHRAIARGRGVILVSGHLGNWELGLQFLACYFKAPLHLVVKRLPLEPLDRWLRRFRTRFGSRIIDKKRAFPAMRSAIRAGGVVAIMVDISRVKQSVAVDFFGRRARASHAAALLSARSGATVMPLFSHRNPDGSITIDLGPPLTFQRSSDLKEDLRRNTQLLTDRVEAAVRKHPDQYLWLQKRWKDYYPYLYPGYRPRLEYLSEGAPEKPQGDE